jgi:hypothetical protein
VEFTLCYCKFEEKTLVLLLSRHAVWSLYCTLHDARGNYYPEGNVLAVYIVVLFLPPFVFMWFLGSPDYIAWSIQRLEAQVSQEAFDEPPPQPLSESTFNRILSEKANITTDKWRSCCCQQCGGTVLLLSSLIFLIDRNGGSCLNLGSAFEGSASRERGSSCARRRGFGPPPRTPLQGRRLCVEPQRRCACFALPSNSIRFTVVFQGPHYPLAGSPA